MPRKKRSTSKADSATKTSAPRRSRRKTVQVGLRTALAPGLPGAWASDHAREAAHVKDWTYIAIRAIALQAAQASVQVYVDTPATKALRQTLLRQARVNPLVRHELLKSLYAGEHRIGEPLPDDSRVMRLLKRPNPQQSGAMFRYECVLNLQATGTCLIWNVPRQLDGLTVERYVIPTACAQPVVPSRDLPSGGWRIDPSACSYRIRSGGPLPGDTFSRVLGATIPADQVQAIRWPHPFVKDDGFSPISAGGALIETGEQVTQARYAQLRNGIDPSFLVLLGDDVDPTPEELDAAAERLNERYAGATNRRKAIILKGGSGSSITTLSHTASDMDFASGFSDYRSAALALQGTPPVAAGIQEAGAYAAYYASLRQFLDLTVQPILDIIAEEDTEHLLPQFGQNLTLEIEHAPIEDTSVREAQNSTLIAAQAITVDELRSSYGLQPLGGARGARLAGAPVTAPQALPTQAQTPEPSDSGASALPRPGLRQRTLSTLMETLLTVAPRRNGSAHRSHRSK